MHRSVRKMVLNRLGGREGCRKPEAVLPLWAQARHCRPQVLQQWWIETWFSGAPWPIREAESGQLRLLQQVGRCFFVRLN